MKYYSRKRIVLSIAAVIASVLFSWIVLYGFGGVDGKVVPIVGGTLLAILLPKLAILLPKIWWYFILERIRELARAIRNED